MGSNPGASPAIGTLGGPPVMPKLAPTLPGEDNGQPIAPTYCIMVSAFVSQLVILGGPDRTNAPLAREKLWPGDHPVSIGIGGISRCRAQGFTDGQRRLG